MNDTTGKPFSKRYLAELEQLLEAEAELRRLGTELLDDPEYRALRERFIEGELTLAQLSERVDNLAMTRTDEDAAGAGDGDELAEDDDDAGPDGDGGGVNGHGGTDGHGASGDGGNGGNGGDGIVIVTTYF